VRFSLDTQTQVPYDDLCFAANGVGFLAGYLQEAIDVRVAVLLFVVLVCFARTASATLILDAPAAAYFASHYGEDTLTVATPLTAAPLMPSNGVQGVRIFGTASATRTGDCFEGDCRGFSLSLNLGGPFTGDTASSTDVDIPITWDFTVTWDRDPAGEVDWLMLWSAWDNTGEPLRYDGAHSLWRLGGTVTPAVPVTGSNVLPIHNLQSGHSLYSWGLALEVNGSFPVGTTLTLDVPSSSIDINPASEVPEPSTSLLALGGLAGLLAYRRRRHARSGKVRPISLAGGQSRRV